MSEWALRRFWKSVTVVEDENGFAIRLDEKPVRTPGKRVLAMPTLTMAERVAEEWKTQTEKVEPLSMPWTRSVNSAIDKVTTQRAAVAAHLAEYAGSDLLCYRAEGPEELALRQALFWDPVLDWISERFDVRLAVTRGVMPVTQPRDALARLARTMDDMSEFQLTGFHDLVTLTGSFALALSTAYRQADPEDIWPLSRIDEEWQIEQWGEDEDAAEHAKNRREAFLHATEFFHAA